MSSENGDSGSEISFGLDYEDDFNESSSFGDFNGSSGFNDSSDLSGFNDSSDFGDSSSFDDLSEFSGYHDSTGLSGIDHPPEETLVYTRSTPGIAIQPGYGVGESLQSGSYTGQTTFPVQPSPSFPVQPSPSFPVQPSPPVQSSFPVQPSPSFPVQQAQSPRTVQTIQPGIIKKRERYIPVTQISQQGFASLMSEDRSRVDRLMGIINNINTNIGISKLEDLYSVKLESTHGLKLMSELELLVFLIIYYDIQGQYEEQYTVMISKKAAVSMVRGIVYENDNDLNGVISRYL